jgi:hypothetical protein
MALLKASVYGTRQSHCVRKRLDVLLVLNLKMEAAYDSETLSTLPTLFNDTRGDSTQRNYPP